MATKNTKVSALPLFITSAYVIVGVVIGINHAILLLILAAGIASHAILLALVE